MKHFVSKNSVETKLEGELETSEKPKCRNDFFQSLSAKNPKGALLVFFKKKRFFRAENGAELLLNAMVLKHSGAQ